MKVSGFHLRLLLCTLLCLWGCEDDSPVGNTGREIIPLKWMGFSETPPENPTQNWVYFNTLEKVSYLFTGIVWDTLALSGLDAPKVTWLGILPEEPQVAEKNSIYMNSIDRITYIYTGAVWIPYSTSGADGLFVEWKGTLEMEPESPELNWVYRNKSDNNLYIFNGIHWEPFSYGGIDGLGINWLGSFAVEPHPVITNDAYYNSESKTSYIYTAANSWELLSVDGTDGGKKFHWMGALDTIPDISTLDITSIWAYHNSGDGNSYILNSGKLSWDLLCISGKDGADGKDGVDGEDGAHGKALVWMGNWSYPPSTPEVNWIYFNTSNETVFIYNGTSWEVFLTSGEDGVDAKPLVWKGELAYPPVEPQKNWAYYNTSLGRTYIFDGVYWDIFSGSGKDAVKKFFFDTTAVINCGDTLRYSSPLPFSSVQFLAQYSGKDSIIHSYEYVKPEWKGSLLAEDAKIIYSGGKFATERHALFTLNDGVARYAYNEVNVPYQGLKVCTLDPETGLGPATDITSYEVDIISAKALNDASYLLSHISKDTARRGVVTRVSLDGSIEHLTISDSLYFMRVGACNEQPFVYYVRNDSGFVKSLSFSGDETESILIAEENVKPGAVFVMLSNGSSLLLYAAGDYIYSRTIAADGSIGAATEMRTCGIHVSDFNAVVNETGEIFFSCIIVSLAKGTPRKHRLRMKLDATGAILQNAIDSESDEGVFVPIEDGKSLLFDREYLSTYDADFTLLKEQKLSASLKSHDRPLVLPRPDGSVLTVWNSVHLSSVLFRKKDTLGLVMRQLGYNRVGIINNSPEALNITLAVKEK